MRNAAPVADHALVSAGSLGQSADVTSRLVLFKLTLAQLPIHQFALARLPLRRQAGSA